MLKQIPKLLINSASYIRHTSAVYNFSSKKISQLQDWQIVQLIHEQLKKNNINEAIRYIIKSHLHNIVLDRHTFNNTFKKLDEDKTSSNDVLMIRPSKKMLMNLLQTSNSKIYEEVKNDLAAIGIEMPNQFSDNATPKRGRRLRKTQSFSSFCARNSNPNDQPNDCSNNVNTANIKTDGNNDVTESSSQLNNIKNNDIENVSGSTEVGSKRQQRVQQKQCLIKIKNLRIMFNKNGKEIKDNTSIPTSSNLQIKIGDQLKISSNDQNIVIKQLELTKREQLQNLMEMISQLSNQNYNVAIESIQLSPTTNPQPSNNPNTNQSSLPNKNNSNNSNNYNNSSNKS